MPELEKTLKAIHIWKKAANDTKGRRRDYATALQGLYTVTLNKMKELDELCG